MNIFQVLNIKIFQLLNGLAGENYIWDWFFVFVTDYLGYIMILILIIHIIIDNLSQIKKFSFDFIINNKKILLIIISSTVTLSVVYLLKNIIDSPRPVWFFANNMYQLVVENGYDSFPSRHTSFYFAVAISTYYYNKKVGNIFVFFAIVIAISRVVVGAHFPFDVLAGFIVAVVVVFCTKYFLQKLT